MQKKNLTFDLTSTFQKGNGINLRIYSVNSKINSYGVISVIFSREVFTGKTTFACSASNVYKSWMFNLNDGLTNSIAFGYPVFDTRRFV